MSIDELQTLRQILLKGSGQGEIPDALSEIRDKIRREFKAEMEEEMRADIKVEMEAAQGNPQQEMRLGPAPA